MNLMKSGARRGTILLAHGSRDPAWQKPIEAIANRMRLLTPDAPVRCAYLELARPDLAASAAELVAAGVTTIIVLPLFLGIGKHAREDLPTRLTELQACHPQVTFDLRPAIGENPQLIELIARIALA